MNEVFELQVFQELMIKAIEGNVSKIPANSEGAKTLRESVIGVCEECSRRSAIEFDPSEVTVTLEWYGFGCRIPEVKVVVENKELVKWMRDNGIQEI